MATELATGYVSISANTEQVPRQLANAFESAGERAGRVGGEAAGGGILDSLKGMGAAGVAGAMGAAFVGAGALVAKTFWNALQSGMDQQKTLNLNAVRSGADPATMAKIGRAAADAYVSAFGDSVEDNIGNLSAAFSAGLFDSDFTQTQISTMGQQLQAVATVLDTDVAQAIKATSVLLKAGLADDAEHALNIISTAAQKGANFGEDLLENITEYSSGWKQAGIDAETALALIAQAGEAGIDVGDRAADALREFGRRMTEEADTIQETLGELAEVGGLINPEKIFKDLGKGGQEGAAAFDAMFDAVRRVEDPAKRTELAFALLGDTSGDFIYSFQQWDPSAAVAKFGQTADAAQGLVDRLGVGGANSLASAQRSIEVSTNAISLALAQAFGPELAKLADWVSNHQPEILGFLGATADAVIQVTQGMMGMAYWAVKAGEMILRGIGNSIGWVAEPLGKMISAIGEITGNETLSGLGDDLKDVRQGLLDAADGAGSMADGLITGMDKLDGMRESLATNVTAMQNHAAITRALGDEVEMIPSEVDILIKSNTPEQQAALEALGLKLVELDDQPGVFKVVSNTTEGQQAINDFVSANTGKLIPLKGYVSFETSLPVSALKGIHEIPENAAGGFFRGAGGPTDDANLSLISNGEFIVNAKATGRNRSLLEAINAGWTPSAEELRTIFGDIPGYAGGGIVPGKTFANSVDSATYQLGGFSSAAMDCSGMVSATVNSALGRDPYESRMSTASEGEWLAARGAVAGLGGAGDMSIGWTTSGASGGHTAMTLADGTNVESNGSEGVVIGGPVGAGHSMFDQFMHFTPAAMAGGDLGGGAGGLGGAGGGTGGGGLGGAGGGGGTAGGGGGGGTFNSASIPAGVTPVWIVGSSTSTTSPSDTSSVAPDAATTTSTTSNTSGVQTMQEAWDTGISRFGDVGTSFFEGQVDDALGTIGLSRSGGAIQEIASIVYSKVTEAIQAELKKQSATQARNVAGFGSR